MAVTTMWICVHLYSFCSMIYSVKSYSISRSIVSRCHEANKWYTITFMYSTTISHASINLSTYFRSRQNANTIECHANRVPKINMVIRQSRVKFDMKEYPFCLGYVYLSHLIPYIIILMLWAIFVLYSFVIMRLKVPLANVKKMVYTYTFYFYSILDILVCLGLVLYPFA